jgi:hypothetical protein
MKRVSDVVEWPPQPGDSYRRGGNSPQSSEEARVERVLFKKDGHLLFTCRIRNESVHYDLPIMNDELEEKIMNILRNNCDKTLFEVGFIEVPSTGEKQPNNTVDRKADNHD